MNSPSAVEQPVPANRAVFPTPSRAWDTAFRILTGFMAMLVLVLVVLVGWTLFKGSRLSLQKFGFGFFIHSDWDPVSSDFGALPFIFGTFVSSLVGLMIALPLSLATAIYLTELAPKWVRQPAVSLIEMIAAIPSVILGLWGIFVMVPWLRDHPFPFLKKYLGFLPLFQGPIYGVSVLAAAIIIAIMIVPIITSISREVFRAVPDSQREAAFALGGTRWEVTRLAVLRHSTRGIFGAAMLGLGRALGETMAVTMVIGNRPEISKSLLAPGYTLASCIANEFTEATTDIYLSALFELGLVLLIVTIVTNLLAHLLIGAVGSAAISLMTAKSDLHRSWRKAKSSLISFLCFLCAILVILPLVLVLFHLIKLGASSLDWRFITHLPKPVGETGGGMANAIVGSLILVGLAVVVGVPIGVLGGIYLAEFGAGRVNFLVRFGADILNGTPSIVWGIVVYALVVVPMKGFSAYAGGLALGFMMIPLVIRTTEEMLALVPNGYREAALALGIPQWKSVVHIILKTAGKGIITGILLACARIAGETAPLLFTAFGNHFWSHKLSEPISALPLQIFSYAIAPYDDWHRQAWAGALVLIFLAFAVNVGVRIITRGRAPHLAK